MNLSDAAVIIAAVVGATISGAVSIYIFWRQSKAAPQRRKAVRDVWQQQALALAEQLRVTNERREAYLEAQIEDFKRQERARHTAARRNQGGDADDK